MLRTIRHPDKAPDVHPLVAKRIEIAVLETEPLFRSEVHASRLTHTALSVHAYIEPYTGNERFALVLSGAQHANVVKDAVAKRHVLNVYRDLVWHGENTHLPTGRLPHAWDYSDVPEVPTNRGADCDV